MTEEGCAARRLGRWLSTDTESKTGRNYARTEDAKDRMKRESRWAGSLPAVVLVSIAVVSGQPRKSLGANGG